jgi:hypothetical protein
MMQPSQDLDVDQDPKSRVRPRNMVLAALAAGLLGLVPFCFFIVDQAEITRSRLYIEAMERILPRVKMYVVDSKGGRMPFTLRVGKP